jgi:Protein adenylyltransferase SelO
MPCHALPCYAMLCRAMPSLSSDNTLLGGRTIDYGPFGWMEKYDPMYQVLQCTALPLCTFLFLSLRLQLSLSLSLRLSLSLPLSPSLSPSLSLSLSLSFLSIYLSLFLSLSLWSVSAAFEYANLHEVNFFHPVNMSKLSHPFHPNHTVDLSPADSLPPITSIFPPLLFPIPSPPSDDPFPPFPPFSCYQPFTSDSDGKFAFIRQPNAMGVNVAVLGD